MKFKWKLFLGMMTVMTLAYSISGSMMVTLAFRTTYDKEVDLAKEEHEILQDTFVMVLSHLSQSVTDEMWRQVAKDLDDSSAREDFYFWIGGEGETDIYQSNSMRKEKVPAYQQTELEDSGCYLYTDSNRYFLMTRSSMSSDNGLMYLNLIRDITDIFSSRDEQLNIFYRIMVMVMVFTAAFSYMISYHLTKPLSRLSEVAKKIAEGELSVRSNIETTDEIGELAVDIDLMANSLQKNIEELNDAVRRQEDFVGNFAHELKTPLTSIIGYADMLRSRKMSQEHIFSSANYIFTEGKRLEGMSFKLLDLMVTKQQKIVLKKVDAEYFFDMIKGALEPILQKDEIKLSNQVQKGFLMADLDLLKSVIFNLVDNARKAKKENSQLEISILGTIEGNEYKIEVRDNGDGIPKTELDKITEAFYMVDKSRAREQGGAGLGLALCKQIIEIHEGSMRITSDIGRGTYVLLTLKGGDYHE